MRRKRRALLPLLQVASRRRPAYRAERIKEEVIRTLVVGIDDLPENTEVNQAIFFTGESKPRPVGVYSDDEDVDDEAGSISHISDDSEYSTTAALLAKALVEAGVNIDFINPFRLPGIKLKKDEPENPGRYASALGMILAGVRRIDRRSIYFILVRSRSRLITDLFFSCISFSLE